MKKKIFIASALTLLVSATVFLASCNEALPSSAQSGFTLTKNDAKDIALSNLGVTELSATPTVVTPEKMNDKEYYSVEVTINGITYRYRIDASNGNIEKIYVNDEPVESAPAVMDPVESTPTYIGFEQAKQIALADAGVSEADVTKLDHELEYSGGKHFYEVDFTAGGVKYEYTVDVISGEIAKKNVNDVTVIEPTVGSDIYVGVDAAIQKAFEHAGVSEADATLKKAEWDTEKGSAVYEIDFSCGGTKYEYTVNAVSGEVIYFKSETAKTPDANGSQSTEADVTMKEAKAIALAHAGLTEADVRWDDCELEKSHGLLVYEIDFKSGAYEYEYVIDAESGKIIVADKEYDD